MTALYTGLYMPFGLGKGIQRDDAHVQILHIYMKYEILITLLPEKENKKDAQKMNVMSLQPPPKKATITDFVRLALPPVWVASLPSFIVHVSSDSGINIIAGLLHIQQSVIII